MATASIEVPHVYKALGEILKAMKVEKSGTLPSNLGGKKYIPAPAISEEVKRQLVDNDLILLSNEEIVGQESVINKDRITIRVVVTGTYTFVSLVDGSEASVSGSGDGIATATAVAANIASTNAQKNALLRTLLISEESVETASQTAQGTAAASTPVQRKLDKARAAKPAAKTESSSRDKIRTEFIDKNVVTREQVNALTEAIKKADGLSGNELYDAVLARLEKGEVG